MPNTVWNVLDVHSKWTLSGGGLTAVAANVTGDGGVVVVDGKSTGQYYFEIRVSGTGTSGNSGVGVQTLSPGWANLGATSTSAAMCYPSGTIWYSGATTGLTIGTAWANNDVICVALDLTNNKIWFRKNAGNWNNNAAHNPATNANGVSIASLVATGRPWYICANAGTTLTPTFVLNVGDTTFAQAVPAGFTAGWPTNTITSRATAFDPATKTSSLNLSNGGLTASAIYDPVPQRVKTTGYGTTGKYYWEFYVNATLVQTGYGISSLTPLTDNTFTNGQEAAIHFSTNTTGSIWINSVNSVASVAGLLAADGQVSCIAADFDADLIWFRTSNSTWNNSGTADPATGVGGLNIAVLGASLFPTVCGNVNNSWRVSLNNTDAPKIPPPAGFIVGPPPYPGSAPTDPSVEVIRGLLRETVLQGPEGRAQVRGLIRETIIAPNAEARVSQLIRESLIVGDGRLQIGQLVREALVSGTAPSGTIGASQSGISGSLTAGAPPVFYNATVQSSSGVSAQFALAIPVSARINATSGISITIPLPASFSKIESYAIIVNSQTSMAKADAYAVLVSGTEALTKLQGYVILVTQNKMDLTKINSYGVLNRPVTLTLSKASSYAIVRVPPLNAFISKVNSYAVVRTHLTPGDEWPWLAIASL